MKTSTLVLLPSIFLLQAPDSSFAQNLVRNPGFEQGEDRQAHGWVGMANAGAPSFLRTDEQACEGKHAAKLVAREGDVYARWVHRRPDLFGSVKARDKLRLRFRYLASADVGDAPVQVNMNAAPGWRQYTLKPLRATGGRWADYEAELTVDVAPNGSGEVQLRGTTNRVGDQIVYFDDVSLEVVGRDPLPKPQPFPVPRGDQRMVTPSQLHTIQCDTSELPLKTAAEELCRFVNERQDRDPLTISRPAEDAPRPGTLVLGTPEDNASLARWTRQGKLSVTERSETVDSYEIAEVDGCVAVVGANPRALVYGAFELEDLLVEHGGLSEGFRSLARPTLDTRLLHPRARGGFGSYLREDFEFIARAGANVGHLGHDWMGEKTLLSFVPSTSPTTPSRCVTCSWVH